MNALVLFCWMATILRLAGKLDGKVIPLHINAGDMDGDQLLVIG